MAKGKMQEKLHEKVEHQVGGMQHSMKPMAGGGKMSRMGRGKSGGKMKPMRMGKKK